MIDNKIESMTWHAAKLEDVLAELGAKPRDGLTAAQAAALLARHGPNQLPAPPRNSLLKRFLLQFHNVLIYVLLAAAIGTAILDEWIDTGVILGVVVINALIGVVQEGKAEKALDSIRAMLSQFARQNLPRLRPVGKHPLTPVAHAKSLPPAAVPSHPQILSQSGVIAPPQSTAVSTTRGNPQNLCSLRYLLCKNSGSPLLHPTPSIVVLRHLDPFPAERAVAPQLALLGLHVG